MITFLHAFQSLAEPHSSVSVPFVTALMPSSLRDRGLPLFLVPPPIPNIIDFSKLFSLRMICSKYSSCCFFINASSGFVGFISSITDLLDLVLAVHGIHSSLLQHHNSKLSILLLSAYLIVQDPQPCSTTGKTNAFTILHFVVIVISLSFHMLFSPVIAVLSNANRPKIILGPVFTNIYQYCLFSVISEVILYLLVSSLMVSNHIPLLLFSGKAVSIFFLEKWSSSLLR